MYKKTFTLYDIFVTVLSFFSYILDVVSDVAVIVVFFLDGHAVWGAISLAFVALSTFAMQIFSFCWHVTDGSMTVKNFLIHAFFLAPLHRYWRVLKLGIKSRRTKNHDDLDAVYCANNDICLLRLFESFLESAPQLLLQLYVIITFQHFDWIIGISTFFSLTSIAWSVSAYSDGLRLAYQTEYKRSGLTMLVHTLWQTAMLSGRVLAIVVFASHFKAWTFLVLGLHWLLMTAWITVQNADFGDTACEKRIFNAVSGFIYVFCFLNLKDGSSRRRLAVYYIVSMVENTALVILWFLYKSETSPDWLSIVAPTVIYGGFALGSIMMCLYYCCCHPSMPKVKQEKEQETNWFKRIVAMKRQEHRDSFFNTSDSSFRISEWLTTSVNLSNCDRQNNSVQLSLNSAVPDVIPVRNSTRFLSGKSLSTYHRAPSIESSLQESDGNLTLESGRVSYISASSSKQLIPSSSKTLSHKIKAEVNRAFSRDHDSSSGLVLTPQDSPQSFQSCMDSSNEISTNKHFSLLSQKNDQQQKKDSPQSLQSWKEDVATGSGSSSFEYGRNKLSMSPLDPAKLWELSQQRITLEPSSYFNDSKQQSVSQPARENDSCRLTSYFPTPVDSSINGTKSSLARTSHRSTTFSDSQYNSNSEVSGERYDGSYSYSGTSRSQYRSQSNTGTSDQVESSELSNFFADISSLHVPVPSHGRYISSVSDITDQMNASFPWPDDHEVFYDEGDISEMVYKQNIRESLQGKSYMYHICQISDFTQAGETPRRLSYSGPSNTEPRPNSNGNQRINSLPGNSFEKNTDDSGYHFSETDENSSSNINPYKGAFNFENHQKLNKAVIINSSSSDMSQMKSDNAEGGTPRRRSLLPGLSYLMSDSDTSFMDSSTEPAKFQAFTPEVNDSPESWDKNGYYTSHQNKKVSPLQVSTIETSPMRLGRSVDLFDSSKLEMSDLETPKAICSKPPIIPPISRLEELQVVDLKESPYKFRGRSQDNVLHCSSNENERDELSISDLTESPYKFRSKCSENIIQSKTNRKFYTIPEKRVEGVNIPHKRSQARYNDKENRVLDENGYHTAPMLRNKKKKGIKAKSAEKHSKPKTHVSALKYSCYAYSDTDSDGDIPSDFSARSQYGDASEPEFEFSPMKSYRRESTSRTALKSVENSPTFSPIITPDRMNREKVCNANGPLMKPFVSTPVPRSAHGGSENALYLVDEPSTIAV